MKKLLTLVAVITSMCFTSAFAQMQNVSPTTEFTESDILSATPVGEDSGPKVKVYPNPSTGAFNITILEMEGSRAKVELLDITGKKIHSTTVFPDGDRTLVRIDLSEYPNGVYLLQVKSAEKVRTVQLIKQQN